MNSSNLFMIHILTTTLHVLYVTTMPDGALNAFVDHGTVARTIGANLPGAKRVYDKVEELGTRWEDVGNQLEHEGVASFMKSFTVLVQNLTGKADALAKSKDSLSLTGFSFLSYYLNFDVSTARDWAGNKLV